MKRRDFLKKAGLAVVAAPILGQVIKATPSQVVDDTSQVIPHDPYFFPEKYSMDPFFATSEFDDPKQIEKLRPYQVFTSLEQQTTYLQKHFAKHAAWQEFNHGKWRLPGREVIVSRGTDYTYISFLSCGMIVNLDAKIVSCPCDEMRILQTSPLSGNELNWFWRPVRMDNDNVYPAGYRDKLILTCRGRTIPKIGTLIAFSSACPTYTVIEVLPLAKHRTEAGRYWACSVLLDRPLEAKVFSNKYWVVSWKRGRRPILDQNLRTVTLG